jgi:hypothetical protein
MRGRGRDRIGCQSPILQSFTPRFCGGTLLFDRGRVCGLDRFVLQVQLEEVSAQARIRKGAESGDPAQ